MCVAVNRGIEHNPAKANAKVSFNVISHSTAVCKCFYQFFFICAFDILWSWLSNLFLLLLQLVSAFGHKKLRDLLHFQINIAQMLLTLAFE